MSAATFQILLVEDNSDDVYLFSKALAGVDLDFKLIVLTDGAQALSFIRREAPYAERPVPDLALLDLNLPKSDGIEVLQALRQSADLLAVPVVVTSSSESPRERLNAERLGLERYLRKPSNLDDFLQLGPVLKQILLKAELV